MRLLIHMILINGLILFTSRSLAGTYEYVANADSRDYSLTVTSNQGSPVPSVGVHTSYCWRSSVTCSVNHSVTNGESRLDCSGWTGTGSVPALGTTNSVGIVLTNLSSSVNWTWVSVFEVNFDLGLRGSRIGGGELVQDIALGETAIAPLIAVTNGWLFEGWSETFSNVTSNVTITALYGIDASVDVDLDDMPDGWETEYFGNITISDGTGDFDQDGISDHDEYICGTEPNNSLSVFKASLSNMNGTVINWGAVEGRSYNILWTMNLTNTFQLLNQTELTYPQNSYTDIVHTVEPTGYYRMSVDYSE